jgi:hypothetical protein
MCLAFVALAIGAPADLACADEDAISEIPLGGPVWPAAKPEEIKEAEKLLDEYLKPVTPVEPSEADRSAIAKLIEQLGAEDFAAREDASGAVVKHGPAALGQLRAALTSKDAEVVTRAEAAIERIGQEARAKPAARLKAIPGATVQACGARQQQLSPKITEAYQKAQRARAAGRTAEAEAAEHEHAALLAQSTLLQSLLGEICSSRFQIRVGR